MNAREFLLSVRRTRTPDVARLFDRIPWLLADTIDRFVPYIECPEADDRLASIYQPLAMDFHSRAGTLDEAVKTRIANLEPGKILRLAHQPNFFAYAKLIGQFFALEALAITGIAPLYYYIDYDTVSDDKFRRCTLPDPTSPTGRRRVQLPRSFKEQRTAVAVAVPKPSEAWLGSVISQIRDLASMYSKYGLTDERAEERASWLIHDLEYSWYNCRNTAEMTAILLSRFVNLRLQLSIPFVPGSAVWKEVAPINLQREVELVALTASALQSAHKALTESGLNLRNLHIDPMLLPWWYICNCGSRVPLYLTEKRISGKCPHCSTIIHQTIFSPEWWNSLDRTAPRILLHNLLNRSGFGYQAGVNHIGSAEHVIFHSLALDRRGGRPIPQLLWECTEPYFLSQSEPPVSARDPLVTSGNAFLYFALCYNQDVLREAFRTASRTSLSRATSLKPV
jgi:hypothetical protein